MHLGVVDVAGRIRPLVGIRPGQGHVAHAQAVEIAQHADVVFDGVSAFHAQQRGELLLRAGARAHDVLGAVGHHHLVGMIGGLLVDRIDQIQRAPGVVAVEVTGLDPDGKEFGAEISLADFLQVDVALVPRGGGPDVESLIEKALRRIGVGVNHDGGIVEPTRLGRHRRAGVGHVLRAGGETHRQRQQSQNYGNEESMVVGGRPSLADAARADLWRFFRFHATQYNGRTPSHESRPGGAPRPLPPVRGCAGWPGSFP